MRFASALFAAVAVTAVGSFLLVRQRPEAPRPQSVLLLPGDKDLLRRMEAKNGVTRQLLDGELTLPQAAAAFRRIEMAYPANAVSAPTDENPPEAERYYRTAILWAVEQARGDSSARAAEASRRLNAELDAALAGGRPLELPDVP